METIKMRTGEVLSANNEKEFYETLLELRTAFKSWANGCADKFKRIPLEETKERASLIKMEVSALAVCRGLSESIVTMRKEAGD